MDPCGRVGLIVTQPSPDETATAQGACVGPGHLPEQVNPILPIARRDDGSIRGRARRRRRPAGGQRDRSRSAGVSRAERTARMRSARRLFAVGSAASSPAICALGCDVDRARAPQRVTLPSCSASARSIAPSSTLPARTGSAPASAAARAIAAPASAARCATCTSDAPSASAACAACLDSRSSSRTLPGHAQQRAALDQRDRSRKPGIDLAQDALHQPRDLVDPLAQRRQPHLRPPDAVIQILSKAARARPRRAGSCASRHRCGDPRCARASRRGRSPRASRARAAALPGPAGRAPRSRRGTACRRRPAARNRRHRARPNRRRAWRRTAASPRAPPGSPRSSPRRRARRVSRRGARRETRAPRALCPRRSRPG